MDVATDPTPDDDLSEESVKRRVEKKKAQSKRD